MNDYGEIPNDLAKRGKLTRYDDMSPEQRRCARWEVVKPGDKAWRSGMNLMRDRNTGVIWAPLPRLAQILIDK